MEQKQCSKCGTVVEQTVRFCVNCGSNEFTPIAIDNTQHSSIEQQQDNIAVATQNQHLSANKTEAKKKGLTKWRIALIISGIVLLFGIVLTAFIIFQQGFSDISNNSSSYNADHNATDNKESEAQKPTTKSIDFSPEDQISFEDAQFARFLQIMFNKSEILGSDLLSVQYLGYYEGSPTEVSKLENRGTYSYLYDNSVLFSAQPFSNRIDQTKLLCGNAKGDTLEYRNGCTLVTVRSNEWMAEHVMPYLYYFKNLKCFTYGYCWIGNNVILPEGADIYGTNPHSHDLHDPYDPFYDGKLENEYLSNLVGVWYSSRQGRSDTLTITSDRKMYTKFEYGEGNIEESTDALIYEKGIWWCEVDGVRGAVFELVFNQDESLTVTWLADNSTATFRRIE